MKKPYLFIFAGEASGDLHGSRLLKALVAIKEDLIIEAVAGPLMRALKVHPFMKTEEFSVMGFIDVFLALPKLIKNFYKIRNHILTSAPDAVVLIDYPGFNLRLAANLRKKGYTGKIIQYISPTVWAHGKSRMDEMNATLDLLLTVYPFEKEYFAHLPLKVEYVGHPIRETIESYTYKPLEKNDKAPLIAIFPGSRKGEIKRNFPKILESLKIVQKSLPEMIAAISIAHDQAEALFLKLLKESGITYFFVPKEKTYELMQACDVAIAKSGTVTLELALHKKPSVVVYELGILNRLIAKHILRLKLPFYCIVNILKKALVFPEFIEKKSTPKEIAEEVKELLSNLEKRRTCIDACEEISALLHETNSSKKAATSILRELVC